MHTFVGGIMFFVGSATLIVLIAYARTILFPVTE